jgi:hypothetical protein
MIVLARLYCIDMCTLIYLSFFSADTLLSHRGKQLPCWHDGQDPTGFLRRQSISVPQKPRTPDVCGIRNCVLN